MKNNFFFDIHVHKLLENTNDYAKKQFLKKKTNIAIVAIEQVNGRGRVNRKWISSEGDLTCSFLINQCFSVDKIGQINIWFAHKLLILLKDLFPNLDLKIKWPNDLYLNNKKVGGILTETSIIKNKLDFFLFGVGINLVSAPNNVSYPTDSLSKYLKKIDAITLFFKISKMFTNFVSELNNDLLFTIDEKFLKNFKDYKRQIKIKVKKRTFEGEFSSLSHYGELLLLKNNKIKKINFGDII